MTAYLTCYRLRVTCKSCWFLSVIGWNDRHTYCNKCAETQKSTPPSIQHTRGLPRPRGDAPQVEITPIGETGLPRVGEAGIAEAVADQPKGVRVVQVDEPEWLKKAECAGTRN